MPLLNLSCHATAVKIAREIREDLTSIETRGQAFLLALRCLEKMPGKTDSDFQKILQAILDTPVLERTENIEYVIPFIEQEARRPIGYIRGDAIQSTDIFIKSQRLFDANNAYDVIHFLRKIQKKEDRKAFIETL